MLLSCCLYLGSPALASPVFLADGATLRTGVSSYLVFDVSPGNSRPPVIDHASQEYSRPDGAEGGDPPGFWSHSVTATSHAASGDLFASASATAALSTNRSSDFSFNGAGSVSASWDDNVGSDARAYSLGTNELSWGLVFELESSYDYVLDYVLTCCYSTLTLRQYIEATDSERRIFAVEPVNSIPPMPTLGQISGRLDPGRYSFLAFARANLTDSMTIGPPGVNDTSLEFTMQLTPVPLPTSIWLLGTALAGMAGAKWRRIRSKA